MLIVGGMMAYMVQVGRLEQLMRAGKVSEAMAECKTLLTTHPRHPDILHALGSLLAVVGDSNGALDYFDAALEIRITHPGAQTDLCTLLAHRGGGQATGRYLVTVITATIGTAYLARAIESVQAQTYAKVEHVVVVDGPDGVEAAKRAIPNSPHHPVHLINLPFNTGGGGFNGHRIYGAAVFLISGRYVAFLDEDNFIEPDHLAKMMDLIETNGLQWAYSLRKLVDATGQAIAKDDCESLGRWPSWEGNDIHVVDTNCYLIRRDIILSFSPVFYRRYRDELSPDTALCDLLIKHAPNFGCSGAYSSNYRIEQSETSVKGDFFRAGNEVMRKRYKHMTFPWNIPATRPMTSNRGSSLGLALSEFGRPMLRRLLD